MKWHFLLAFLLITTGQMSYGQKAEVLTNKTVTDLYKAGLDNSIILSKIESSTCKFDVSAIGLVTLKKEGVPAEIIRAMMDKAEGKTRTTPTVAPLPNRVTKEYPDIELINIPHSYDSKVNAIKALEKSVVSIKGKISLGNVLLPVSNTSIVFKIDNEASPVRIQTSDTALFLANSGSGTPDIFKLYRLTVKKGKREGLYMKEQVMKREIQSDVVAFSYKKVKEGMYEIIPATKLSSSEYCLMNSASIGTYGGTKADVYAFGVD